MHVRFKAAWITPDGVRYRNRTTEPVYVPDELAEFLPSSAEIVDDGLRTDEEIIEDFRDELGRSATRTLKRQVKNAGDKRSDAPNAPYAAQTAAEEASKVAKVAEQATERAKKAEEREAAATEQLVAAVERAEIAEARIIELLAELEEATAPNEPEPEPEPKTTKKPKEN